MTVHDIKTAEVTPIKHPLTGAVIHKRTVMPTPA
jgi:hypothetical protein